MPKGLELKDLFFSYPYAKAPVLKGLDLFIPSGRCAAVTGANGSGKTTLVKIVAGIIPRFASGELKGALTLNGGAGFLPAAVLQDLDSQLMHDTVRSELSFFMKYGSAAAGRADLGAACAEMDLLPLMDRSTSVLSSGQKQRFLLACALFFSGKELVVLDEPNAFLDPAVRSLLVQRLLRLKTEGSAILLAGHDFAGFEGVIDDFYELSGGKLQPGRAPAPLTTSVRRYSCGPVGISARSMFFAPDGGAARVLKPSAMDLCSGCITGLTGPNGSGKTSVARLLSGYYPAPDGSILFGGRPVPRKWLQENVMLVSARPINQLTAQSVEENLRISFSRAGGKGPIGFDAGIDMAGLRPLLKRRISCLSYGEMQKVLALSSVLAAPEALIMDEPLLSLDRENFETVLALFSGYVSGSKSILLISHMDALVRTLCSKTYSIENSLVRESVPLS